jgi:hypothetical protein
LQAGDVMAIQSSLLKPIYVAYALGTDSDKKISYDEPIKIYAQIEDVKSLITRDNVGIVPDYDRLILVPYGEKTKFIDEQSLLWVAVEPNTTKSNSDYKIDRVGDVIDGNFILYCNSTTPNTQPIYYEHKEKIYQVKVDFNSDELVAFVPLNKYLPINQNTKIWATQPQSVDSTKNILKLVKIDNLGKSRKFVFKKVEE